MIECKSSTESLPFPNFYFMETRRAFPICATLSLRRVVLHWFLHFERETESDCGDLIKLKFGGDLLPHLWDLADCKTDTIFIRGIRRICITNIEVMSWYGSRRFHIAPWRLCKLSGAGAV